MSFKEGNKVRVIQAPHYEARDAYEGVVGEVIALTGGGTYMVRFREMNCVRSFFDSELELVDEKSEALIELAEILNTARLHIYNSESLTNGITERGTNAALMDVIDKYYSHQGLRNTAWIAGRTFSEVIHGKSVREAIAEAGK